MVSDMVLGKVDLGDMTILDIRLCVFIQRVRIQVFPSVLLVERNLIRGGIIS
jgi:hypothetical protein